MITSDDILLDADVAKLAGLKVETFQRKMKRGFSRGELNWPAADPVTNGRTRLWFRKDVERIWKERIRVETDRSGTKGLSTSKR